MTDEWRNTQEDSEYNMILQNNIVKLCIKHYFWKEDSSGNFFLELATVSLRCGAEQVDLYSREKIAHCLLLM